MTDKKYTPEELEKMADSTQSDVLGIFWTKVRKNSVKLTVLAEKP